MQSLGRTLVTVKNLSMLDGFSELSKLSQFAAERRLRYVSAEGWRYRGNCTDTESFDGFEGEFGGALGRG